MEKHSFIAPEGQILRPRRLHRTGTRKAATRRFKEFNRVAQGVAKQFVKLKQANPRGVRYEETAAEEGAIDDAVMLDREEKDAAATRRQAKLAQQGQTQYERNERKRFRSNLANFYEKNVNPLLDDEFMLRERAGLLKELANDPLRPLSGRQRFILGPEYIEPDTDLTDIDVSEDEMMDYASSKARADLRKLGMFRKAADVAAPEIDAEVDEEIDDEREERRYQKRKARRAEEAERQAAEEAAHEEQMAQEAAALNEAYATNAAEFMQGGEPTDEDDVIVMSDSEDAPQGGRLPCYCCGQKPCRCVMSGGGKVWGPNPLRRFITAFGTLGLSELFRRGGRRVRRRY